MRLGLPGLANLVKNDARRDPFQRGIYVFVSNDKRRVKIFWYQDNGFAMFYKFTNNDTFKIEHTSGKSYRKITAINLSELLKGVPKKVLRNEKNKINAKQKHDTR